MSGLEDRSGHGGLGGHDGRSGNDGRGGHDGRSGHALVLGDGDARTTRAGLDAAWPGWDDGVTTVIAADGGARLAASLGLDLDRWIGDGDSYPAADVDRLAAAGVDVRRLPREKDESDLELAVLAAA